MKATSLPSLVRLAAFATLLSSVSALSAATAPASDAAAQLLASTGAISVKNVGPYVERGTFRVQVATKLGRPDVTLADGAWLYRNRGVEGSAARGTLIVRFADGRVSDLTVATPAVVAALGADSRKRATTELVASK